MSLQASSYAQIVNVYQAVGGGWVDTAAGMAPKPQGTLTAQTPPVSIGPWPVTAPR